MKRSQIILFVIFIVLTTGIFIQLKINQKEQPKTLKTEDNIVFVPVNKIVNKAHTLKLVSYGQVSPNREIMVAFKIQGKLKKGDLSMKPGVRFTTGQILYKLENLDAIYTLAARKSSLSNLIVVSLPDIELDFPDQKDKWIAYLNSISPSSEMPPLPNMATKEKMFMMNRNVIQEHYNVISMEVRMADYLYTAPFNGTVLDIYAEPGSIVNPGVQIAKIARTDEYEVKVPIQMKDLDAFKGKTETHFMNSEGVAIATGKIVRISDVINQQTQSTDVYYSVKELDGQKIYNGMFVNVCTNKKETKKSALLPRTAIKNGKVNCLNGTKIKPIEVTIIGAVQDSIYVTGLPDYSSVVLSRMGNIDKKAIYKGIKR